VALLDDGDRGVEPGPVTGLGVAHGVEQQVGNLGHG